VYAGVPPPLVPKVLGRIPIASGHAGNLETPRIMARLAREAEGVPYVLARAQHIAGDAKSATARAHRIRRFLERRVRFHPDPLHFETVKEPEFQLREIDHAGYTSGDCDDIATLGAALGLALGLPARFRVMAFDSGSPYEHVTADLFDGSRWIDLDVSKEFQRVPADFRPAREKLVPI
jgi:transglutaminase-like putative cysteine protease